STACQHTPKSDLPVEQLWQNHLTQLQKITHFQAKGSFTYIAGKTKRYARFFWQQQAKDRYSVHITSSVGSRVAELTVQAEQATLTDNKGNRHTDNDVEYLLQQLTGI